MGFVFYCSRELGGNSFSRASSEMLHCEMHERVLHECVWQLLDADVTRTLRYTSSLTKVPKPASEQPPFPTIRATVLSIV